MQGLVSVRLVTSSVIHNTLEQVTPESIVFLSVVLLDLGVNTQMCIIQVISS